MAKYLQTAAEANRIALSLFQRLPLSERLSGACEIAQLVNLGIRCAPRGVQAAVRLNAVRRAAEDLPVVVDMHKETDKRTGQTYNVLTTRPSVRPNTSIDIDESEAEFC